MVAAALAAHPSEGLLSFSLGALVNALLSGFTSWIEDGASALIVAFGHAVNATTKTPLGANFMTEFDVVWRIGAIFAAPFLVLAAIQAIVRQDLALLARAVFLRLPFALIFGGIAVEIVAQALAATDALSSAILSVAGRPAHTEIAALAGAFVPGPTGLGLSGFIGVFVALLAAFVAFMLWVELVLRSAAVAVATLFIPLALVGLVWSATSHWARRVGETLAALICSKLVIAGVLALAALSLGVGSGLSGAIEGIALLLLAALAPFSLLRLIPIVESGAAAHLEGLSRRGLRAGRDGSALALSGLDGDEMVVEPPRGADVPFAKGLDLGGPEFEAAVARHSAFLDEHAADRPPGGPPTWSRDDG